MEKSKRTCKLLITNGYEYLLDIYRYKMNKKTVRILKEKISKLDDKSLSKEELNKMLYSYQKRVSETKSKILSTVK